MTLSEWMDRNGVPDDQFASRIGADRTTVSRLRRGGQWLSRRLAQAIERETGGEVTAADFVHIEPQR